MKRGIKITEATNPTLIFKIAKCHATYLPGDFHLLDLGQSLGNIFLEVLYSYGVSQVVLVVKNLPANTGDARDEGSIPGLGRSPGGGNGTPLQYSCLENSMGREVWWAHRISKESDMTEHVSTHIHTATAAAAAAKLLQSCPTLCNPIDGSPPGSPVPGMLQERTLEWVAISFSNAWKWKVKVKSLSHVQLLATSWTAAYQAPPPMGFSRQEYWSGVP